jgi:hypothetical protein
MRAHVGQEQTVDHEDRSENGRRTRQRSARTARTEHRAGCARAEARSCLSTFAALKQHKADDGQRSEHLHNGQNYS